MVKTNISELTIILTARVDTEERFANILATLRYYHKYTDCPIILLEADEESYLRDAVKAICPEAEYLYVRDSNPVFHRTHYINEQLRRVKTTNAAVIDSDIVVPTKQLCDTNDILLSSDTVMVYPYDGRFIGEDAYFSDLFREYGDPRIFE